MSFYQGTPNSQTKETHKIESRLCEQEAATLTHIDVQICWVKQRNCIYVVRGRCWSRSSAKKNMLSTLGSTGVFPTNKCPAPKNNRHNLSLFKNILCLYAHLLFHFLASFRTTRVFFRTWTAPVLEETSWSTLFVPSWAELTVWYYIDLCVHATVNKYKHIVTICIYIYMHYAYMMYTYHIIYAK